jgi:hypothetical protein
MSYFSAAFRADAPNGSRARLFLLLSLFRFIWQGLHSYCLPSALFERFENSHKLFSMPQLLQTLVASAYMLLHAFTSVGWAEVYR